MPAAPLILIEFNELCPTLLRRFMDDGLLPNFRALHDSSVVCVSDAGEEAPNLEPWIQWPTVHSGLPFAEHGVFHLGDGRRLGVKCLAEVLSDAGVPAGVFGSMNTNYGRLNGYVVPDPWDRAGEPHPEWLRPFYRTVARQVQESSREGAGSLGDLVAFAWFLATHGLTAGAAAAVVAQLARERLDPGVRWRRPMLLDQLQYDVFRCLNRRLGLRFATFFCNSTAHFQHYHWRNMEPERFPVPPPLTDHASLRDAIPEGYRAMDRLVGRFLRDYPDALLVLCTALSQQPWVETTKCTFRPRRFDTFLRFAGVKINAAAVKPVMAEQFHLECGSETAAALAEARFRDLVMGGEPAMSVNREGTGVFAGCRINDPAMLDRTVTRRADGVGQRFGELFYMIHTMRSGRHHPDGALWFRTGRHRIVPDRVPLTDVAPTILAHFGVAQPEHMRGQALPLREVAEPIAV
jgi:hypothetical protein